MSRRPESRGYRDDEGYSALIGVTGAPTWFDIEMEGAGFTAKQYQRFRANVEDEWVVLPDQANVLFAGAVGLEDGRVVEGTATLQAGQVVVTTREAVPARSWNGNAIDRCRANAALFRPGGALTPTLHRTVHPSVFDWPDFPIGVSRWPSFGDIHRAHSAARKPFPVVVSEDVIAHILNSVRTTLADEFAKRSLVYEPLVGALRPDVRPPVTPPEPEPTAAEENLTSPELNVQPEFKPAPAADVRVMKRHLSIIAVVLAVDLIVGLRLGAVMASAWPLMAIFSLAAIAVGLVAS